MTAHFPLQVLLATLRSCGLKYDQQQLYEDATGVLAHYDDNGDGVLSRLEFCSLACALCPSRHEDLTDRQIHALIRHRWGCREGVQGGQRRESNPESDWNDLPSKSSSFTRRRSRVLKQHLDERDKLLRHCFYLQVVEMSPFSIRNRRSMLQDTNNNWFKTQYLFCFIASYWLKNNYLESWCLVLASVVFQLVRNTASTCITL